MKSIFENVELIGGPSKIYIECDLIDPPPEAINEQIALKFVKKR